MKHDLRMVDTCPSVSTSFIDSKGVVHKPRPRHNTMEEIERRNKSIENRWQFVQKNLSIHHLKNIPHFLKEGEIDWNKLELWKDDDIFMLSLCNKL